MREREAHQGNFVSLEKSPDETRLVSSGNDGYLKVWDINTGEHLQTIQHDPPYERLNISGIKGLSPAQMTTLRELGATVL